MKCINEIQRREKIKCSLMRYYSTEKGLLHREHLRDLQKERMIKYNQYLKTISNEKKTSN